MKKKLKFKNQMSWKCSYKNCTRR